MAVNSRRVLKELYIGIIVSAIVFMIIGCIFIRPIWIYAISIAVGGAGACIQAYSIYDALDRSLELDPKKAEAFSSFRSMLRLLLCLGLMVGAIIIHLTAFVGVTVGLFTLKISALINPFIKKYMNKIDGVDNTLDIEQK